MLVALIFSPAFAFSCFRSRRQVRVRTQAPCCIPTVGLLYYFQCGLGFSEAVSLIAASKASALCKELAACGDVQVRMLLGDVEDNPKLLTSIDRSLRNCLSVFAADSCIAHALRGEREGAVAFSWKDLEDSMFSSAFRPIKPTLAGNLRRAIEARNAELALERDPVRRLEWEPSR